MKPPFTDKDIAAWAKRHGIDHSPELRAMFEDARTCEPEPEPPATHSPGPWTLENGPMLAVGSPGARGVSSRQGPHPWYRLASVITKMAAADFESPVGLANARLICAAPDLLAACKGYMDGLVPLSRFRELADAAIAKAEGRE